MKYIRIFCALAPNTPPTRPQHPPPRPERGKIGMLSPEQAICEHCRRRPREAWTLTGQSTSPCPYACACGGAEIVIPMTAVLPARSTSPVDDISPAAARSGTMTSTATTAVDPPGYSAHTQSPIAPPMPIYSPLGHHGVLEDPSRDPDTWSLVTPTPTTRSQASSIHENNGTPTTSSPPVRAKSPGRGRQVAKLVFGHFTTYILPILFILPPLVLFYIWAWQTGPLSSPGSDFYRKFSWFHTYPSPKLTVGGSLSIVAILYSLIGAVFHNIFFDAWMHRTRVERLRTINTTCSRWFLRSYSCVSFIAGIFYLLMAPLLALAGVLSFCRLLMTPAYGGSQDGWMESWLTFQLLPA